MPISKRDPVADQPTLKLYYFNIKGKGEPIRLFCQYAGLALEDYRFGSRDELQALKEKGTLAFGQVPLLEVDGRHTLVQSSAILRYLSKIAGMYPSDPLVAAKVDAALDQETDAFTGVTVATYSARFGIPMDEAAKARCYDILSTEVLPRHLGDIESLLTSSPSGWVAGTEEPTAADFVWYCRFAQYLPENSKHFSAHLSSLEHYPACLQLVRQMNELPAVQEFYASPPK
jgi:glutathione S-transferase